MERDVRLMDDEGQPEYKYLKGPGRFRVRCSILRACIAGIRHFRDWKSCRYVLVRYMITDAFLITSLEDKSLRISIGRALFATMLLLAL